VKNKAQFKFNSGNLALLCSNCSVIIKTGKDFTRDEMMACDGIKYLKPQYCTKCIEKYDKKN
jgi:hypothetical protein